MRGIECRSTKFSLLASLARRDDQASSNEGTTNSANPNTTRERYGMPKQLALTFSPHFFLERVTHAFARVIPARYTHALHTKPATTTGAFDDQPVFATMLALHGVAFNRCVIRINDDDVPCGGWHLLPLCAFVVFMPLDPITIRAENLVFL